MALQRPPRPQLEVNVDTSLEQQLLTRLDQMNSELQKQGGQLREMKQMLVGTADGPVELPHGRIVSLESRMGKAESDIDGLQRSDLRATAYWNAARIMGHILTGLLGGTALAIAQWLLRAAK